MPAPAKKEATYEDLYHIPDHLIGEIIDGELIASPRPTVGHSDLMFSLGARLAPPFRFGEGGPGGWIFLIEPEIHFGKNVIVPDLAGWKRERFSPRRTQPYVTVPPDWVCEILSPSTARIDRIKKMRIFAEHEVPYAWLIDPILQTLEVYRLESGIWTVRGLYEENEKVRAEPFDAVEIDLAKLWMEEPTGESAESS